MIIVKNKIIPFKGFRAITFWPFIFTRESDLKLFVLNHEEIHGEQQVEMLAVGCCIDLLLYLLGCGCWSLLAVPVYFWWYGMEWLIRLIIYRDFDKAYFNISFEQEAYRNEHNMRYVVWRWNFAWCRYLFKRFY